MDYAEIVKLVRSESPAAVAFDMAGGQSFSPTPHVNSRHG
jgi:hypothetical protein